MYLIDAIAEVVSILRAAKMDAFLEDFQAQINGEGSVIRFSEEIWNFYVGAYQVCKKCLKDRKGCTLSLEDITHYQHIIVALQETIRLMQPINETLPGFPIT